MATRGKVNVTVQVLLVSLVPVANVWAFYRIRRLRRMAACVAVPAAVFIAAVLVLFDPFATYFCPDILNWTPPPGTVSDRHLAVCTGLFPYNIHGIGLLIAVGIAMHAWQVYLIHRWSGEWNDEFGDRGSEELRGA